MAARRHYGELTIQMMDEISLWELCETEDRKIFPYFSYDVYSCHKRNFSSNWLIHLILWVVPLPSKSGKSRSIGIPC